MLFRTGVILMCGVFPWLSGTSPAMGLQQETLSSQTHQEVVLPRLSSYESLHAVRRGQNSDGALTPRVSPGASKVLEDALHALADAQKLSQVRSVSVEGTRNEGKVNLAFVWQDEWSDFKLKTKHTTKVNQHTTVRRFDAVSGNSVEIDGGPRTRRTGSLVSPSLPFYLPLAALLVATRNADFSVDFDQGRPGTPMENVGVAIVQYRGDDPIAASEQDWYFSESTHLPTAVLLRDEDASHPGIFMEHCIYFDRFTTTEIGLAPSVMRDVYPNGHVSTINITNYKINEGLSGQ